MKTVGQVLATNAQQTNSDSPTSALIPRFSRCGQLVNATSKTLEAVKASSYVIQHPLIFSIASETATKLLLWKAQRNTFPGSFVISKKNSFSRLIFYLQIGSKLAPILDNDGIIRFRRRLKNAQISFDKWHPILVSGCGQS